MDAVPLRLHCDAGGLDGRPPAPVRPDDVSVRIEGTLSPSDYLKFEDKEGKQQEEDDPSASTEKRAETPYPSSD